MSKTPEMVERVARAIESKSNYMISQHFAKALARATIAAMREPTAAMTAKGTFWVDSELRAKAEWQEMIDAALAEDGE